MDPSESPAAPEALRIRLDEGTAGSRRDRRSLCSVTDYEVPNKDQWVQYRAQLRDVTTQADPFNIVWPSAPSA